MAWKLLTALATAAALNLGATSPAAAQNWDPTIAVPPQTQTWLSAFPGGSAFAYISGGGPVATSGSVGTANSVLRSSDFGASWTAVEVPETGATEAVTFGSPVRGYTVGNGQVYTSRDAGTSWAATAPLAPRGHPLLDLSVGAHGDSVMVGGRVLAPDDYCGSPTEQPPESIPSVVFTSHDAGRTWTRTALPLSGVISRIEMLDERNALAIVYDMAYAPDCSGASTHSLVYTTSDGGATWREVLDCGGYCLSGTLIDPARLVVGFNDGRVARSIDGGRTFQESKLEGRLPPFEEQAYWVSGIDFADCEVGYLGTNGRGTFRTQDAGKTWQAESSPQAMWGVGIGDLAVADRAHAVVGGPNAVAYRRPAEGERLAGTDTPCPPPPATVPPQEQTPVQPAPTQRARLHLALSHTKLRAGRRTRVVATVTTRRRNAAPVPAAGAQVRAGRLQVTTDRRGRAVLRLRVTRRRHLQITAQHPAHGVATRVLRARR